MVVNKLKKLCVVAVLASAVLGATASLAAEAARDGVVPLEVRGEDFVDPDGRPVRFWGVNLVAFYPSHELAEKVAENLASRQINLVRPHHMLRPSADWVWSAAPIVALQDYSKGNTREPDADAWDRFDYLNAALRKRGIYLMLSVWSTRRYLPGDVDVLETDPADRQAWMDAIAELNSWDWKKAFDVRKMLCVVDERVAALEEEFARQLLTHVNPYTGIAYGKDPQVITLELINEFSSEYTIVCQNRFPDYFQAKLNGKWEQFARERGIEPGDLYKPADQKTVEVRAEFFRHLDESFTRRMRQVVADAGSRVPVAFSNLWRGENPQRSAALENGYIEDHMYADPQVTSGLDDLVYKLCRTPIAGKPFIIGELNQSEGQQNIVKQAPTRSMLPLAASAYGSLHNWSGITFFSWVHGDGKVGPDGWATEELRQASIGNLITDGMQIDHLRTCGMIFRRGLLEKSRSPIVLKVDDPMAAASYHALVRGKHVIKHGWQNIHAIRKSYGAQPPGQAQARWMVESPENPLVSDTGQIVKDIERNQLTIRAPQAEAFSGTIDGEAPAALEHLRISGEGFATVVVVCDDEQDLGSSRRLVISRTAVQGEEEIDGPDVSLEGMRRPGAGEKWLARITRPRDLAGSVREVNFDESSNQLVLPTGVWHECELELR